MPKICCVDDNYQSSLLVDTVLTSVGYSVDLFYSPLKFLDQLNKNVGYDLIVMDICMPEMSGIDCFKKVQLVSADIPVVAMTALALQDELIEIKKVQFSDIVIKPIQVIDFIERVKKLCPIKN